MRDKDGVRGMRTGPSRDSRTCALKTCVCVSLPFAYLHFFLVR